MDLKKVRKKLSSCIGSILLMREFSCQLMLFNNSKIGRCVRGPERLGGKIWRPSWHWVIKDTTIREHNSIWHAWNAGKDRRRVISTTSTTTTWRAVIYSDVSTAQCWVWTTIESLKRTINSKLNITICILQILWINGRYFLFSRFYEKSSKPKEKHSSLITVSTQTIKKPWSNEWIHTEKNAHYQEN